MLNQLKAYPTVRLFVIYCIYLSSITYLAQSFLFTKNVIYNSYEGQISYDRMEEIIND
jgi:hypothetical protein